jgi:hypothetical protein
MKNVFKAVIEKGDFDLTSMIATIDKFCIEGKITDEERHELYALARKSPKAQYNYDTEIEKIWEAIRALQSNGTTEGDTNTPEEFKQPTGAHDAYMKGDVMLYKDGKIYESTIDHNVWAPDVNPNGWKEVEV